MPLKSVLHQFIHEHCEESEGL